MAKLSYNELKDYVNGIVTVAKLSNASFSETRNNVVGLLDKIGKIVTLDTVYNVDKLARFDGEYLSFGKSIEEWSQDLIMPVDYDSDGANALSPYNPTYRPVFYSYTLGKKVIAESIRNNDIERAVHFTEQFVSIVAMQYKRLEDSMAVYRYQLKREILGKLCAIAEGLMDPSNATGLAETSGSKTVAVGTTYKSSAGTPTINGVFICVKPATALTATLQDLIDDGYLIKLDLVQTMTAVTDEASGEAFLQQVKADVEKAQDLCEGVSFNGNSLGATEGLVLIVKQGLMPIIDVQTLAGAFHLEKVAVPVEIVVVKDFGSANSGEFAVLMDSRGMRLHNTYNATRENLNGKGDFLNLFRHTEDTGYISRNTFVKVYKTA